MDDETPSSNAFMEPTKGVGQLLSKVVPVLPNLPQYKPKSGDYQVQVHIIEARQLKGRGLGDMSDPVVQVSVFGEVKSTSIKKSTLNCLWDEVLYFEQKAMEPVRLEMEKLQVSVLDANTFRKNVVIGTYEFDLSSVYFKQDHEVYKCWVALSDTSSDSEGIQGYLRLSVTCLGPDDEQKMHDNQEDDDDESPVLMPPHVEQKGLLLKAQVYDALDLPEMDDGLIGSKCDPYVMVEFGSNRLKSDRKKGVNVSFNQEIQVPVFEPVMSDNLKVQLWDYDIGPQNDDLISTTGLSYATAKTGAYSIPRWINFYGAQTTEKDPISDKMNKGHCEASCYRGRMLCSFSVADNESPQKEVVSIPAAENSAPEMVNWAIQVDLYSAIEVPLKGKWSIEVTCGPYVFSSPEADSNNGMLKWFCSLLSEKGTELQMLFPADDKQIPDVFVYLRRKKHRISYFRQTFTDILGLGYKSPPVWITLKEDKALDKLKENQFPGIVLIGIRVGLASDIPKKVFVSARPFLVNEFDDSNSANSKEVKQAHTSSGMGNLEITIIQGKDLGTGKSADPYVQFTVGSKVVKTKSVKKNLNPLWNETLILEHIGINSIVEAKVYDKEMLSDDLMGTFMLPIGSISPNAPGKDFSVESWFPVVSSKAKDAGKVKLKLSFSYTDQITSGTKPKRALFGSMKSMSSRGRSSSSSGLQGYFGEPAYAEYQIRAHIYQARGLPSMDRNGLSDPYAIVRCAGQSNSTLVKQETLNPLWYHTSCLDVKLPTPLSMAPRIYVNIFDKDIFDRDDLMGHFTISITDAMSMIPQDPTWFDLIDSDGKPVKGQVLACFQVLPAELSKTVIPSLEPESKQMWLEVSTLGLRCLQSTLGIHKPRIEFELPNGKRFHTSESRLPSSTNPNFLQVLKIPVKVPLDKRFAPSLDIEVRDVLLGGWIKRRIGTACLLLENYMYDEEEAWNSSTNNILDHVDLEKKIEAIKHRNEEEEEARIMEQQVQQSTSTPNVNEEETVAAEGRAAVMSLSSVCSNASRRTKGYTEMLEMEEIAADLESKDRQEVIMNLDQGSLSIEREQEALLPAYASRQMIQICDFEEKYIPGDHDIPEYMRGRDVIDDELEDVVAMKPFDEVKLTTGTEKSGKKVRKVGTFKGLVRLLPEKNMPGGIATRDLLNPKEVYVRLYILRGSKLTPKDDNGSSDPYLVVSLGEKTYNLRKEYLKRSLEPEFFEYFEFPTTIPGASELMISVWDYDGISDDLIGSTTIDVENRWFTRDWRLLEKKHVEWRTLHSPTSSMSQGKLQMWLDIVTPSEAIQDPPRNIRPPPPEDWELRVIIWECRDVTIKDTITNQNDLYVTGRLDVPGSKLKALHTDTHLRSKKGKGSFNWRMKFPVTLPVAEPRFSLQIWDKDFFSANDSICEVYISFKHFFRKARLVGDRIMLTKKGKDKFWLENLRHPNEPGVSQGKVLVSFELLPASVASQLKAGFGRSEPNMNPTLPPPEGRMEWNFMKPWKILKDILGENLYRKLCCIFCCLIFMIAFFFTAPMFFSNILSEAIIGIF